MVPDNTDQRGESWELGLQGYYDAAFELLEKILRRAPTDLVTLRMKGNLLELKSLDLMESSSKKLLSSEDYLLARKCYEQILVIDPHNIVALMDLGDHYKNLGANDKALAYYHQAADILEEGESCPSRREHVRELLRRSDELAKIDRVQSAACRLEAQCRRILGNIPAV